MPEPIRKVLKSDFIEGAGFAYAIIVAHSEGASGSVDADYAVAFQDEKGIRLDGPHNLTLSAAEITEFLAGDETFPFDAAASLAEDECQLIVDAAWRSQPNPKSPLPMLRERALVSFQMGLYNLRKAGLDDAAVSKLFDAFQHTETKELLFRLRKNVKPGGFGRK